MPKLRVHINELKKGFRRHTIHVDEGGGVGVTLSAMNLVCYYAVESGLKALYLVRNRQPAGADLPEVIMSHDLRALIRELRLPAHLSSTCPTGFRRRSGLETYPGSEMHLAWRYGVDVNPADEDGMLAALTSLRRYIDLELA